MGICIAICETDAKDALCKEQKNKIFKVLVSDTAGFDKALEYDEYVPADKAKGAVGDWAAFMKRNKFRVEPKEIYLDKIKDENDLNALKSLTVKKPTGWVFFSELDANGQKRAFELSDENNRVTEWDRVEQDEMSEICSKCKCSWDKGRGCMGDFGPTSSMIPVLADKYGCKLLAGVVKASENGTRFTPEDAKQLIKEVDVVIEKMPGEDKGKVYVNRYSGVLERLKAMAETCISQNCGFYFM